MENSIFRGDRYVETSNAQSNDEFCTAAVGCCDSSCPEPTGASCCDYRCPGNGRASCSDDSCPRTTGASQCSCPLSGAAEGGATGRYSFDARARTEADCEESSSAATFGSNTRRATRGVPWLRFPLVRFRLSGERHVEKEQRCF